jgi:hypothetical protein
MTALACRRRQGKESFVAGRRFLDVDPNLLRLPPSRHEGVDPVKFVRHVAQFGSSLAGMPTLEVTEAADGEFVINSGVTRATRVAKYFPGQLVHVEVIDVLPNWDVRKYPTVRDRLP